MSADQIAGKEARYSDAAGVIWDTTKLLGGEEAIVSPSAVLRIEVPFAVN